VAKAGCHPTQSLRLHEIPAATSRSRRRRLLASQRVTCPLAWIDDSPSPSIGVATAWLMDVEPEKERWRNIAKDWYGAGLAEQPGTGKLHHHLGLLSREVEGEGLKGVYHLIKK
jgi:hypothetical protein